MIRFALPSDLPAIVALLVAAGMRTEDLLADRTRYWVAEEGGTIIGSLGLELGSESALLRSVGIVPAFRARGIGKQLTETGLSWARANGFQRVYCFSTVAGSYWIARGFRECPVEEVARELPEAPQVALFRDLGRLPSEVAFRIDLGDSLPLLNPVLRSIS